MLSWIERVWDTLGLWGVLGSWLVLYVIYRLIRDLYEKAREYDVLAPKFRGLEADRSLFEEEKVKWTEEAEAKKTEWMRHVQQEKVKWSKETEAKKTEWMQYVQEDKAAIEELAKEKSLGFPWLATAIAEYHAFQDQKRAGHLQFKPHPARRAASHVREISKQRTRAERLWRVFRYQIEYYESLFPWLSEFKDEDIDDIILRITSGASEPDEDSRRDPVQHWLTEGEYQALTEAERNQLALERYLSRKKRNWEIGRDYERFVGYCIESSGYHVQYHGIVEGLHDLGRDLIATKGSEIKVIQCKRWSTKKQIHEKHICQLFGTVTAFRIDSPQNDVLGVFVTSTSLSDRARQFADMLGIEVEDGFPLEPWPCVKCNVSRRSGEKIYHLPFDQQYDKTVIETERLECYVETALEAEELGFRRAFRWHGDQENSDEG